MGAGSIAVQDFEHNCICMAVYELAGRITDIQIILCYYSRIFDEKKTTYCTLTLLDAEESYRVP